MHLNFRIDNLSTRWRVFLSSLPREHSDHAGKKSDDNKQQLRNAPILKFETKGEARRHARREEVKNTLYPFRHMNRFMGPEELRHSIANVKSHLALTSAIMCGVSSASLLVWIGHPELPFHHEIASTGLTFSTFVCPLYTMSFFFSLQALISAFLVTGYLHATPTKYSAKFAEKHARSIAFAGWLKVPSLVTLGLGVVCHIGATLGLDAAIFAASCYSLMGVITIVQLFLFSRSHLASRKDFEKDGEQ